MEASKQTITHQSETSGARTAASALQTAPSAQVIEPAAEWQVRVHLQRVRLLVVYRHPHRNVGQWLNHRKLGRGQCPILNSWITSGETKHKWQGLVSLENKCRVPQMKGLAWVRVIWSGPARQRELGTPKSACSAILISISPLYLASLSRC